MNQMVVLFTVADLTFWQVVDWGLYLFLFLVPLVLLLSPQLTGPNSPLAMFSIFSKQHREKGMPRAIFLAVLYYASVSIMCLSDVDDVHFHLKWQKAALTIGHFDIATAEYDDPRPTPGTITEWLVHRGIYFGGHAYDTPGGHGGEKKVLPRIRKVVVGGETYRLSVNGDVILKIEGAAAPDITGNE